MEGVPMLERLTMVRPDTGLPVGTITFMLSDIRDSVRLWEADPDAMDRALFRHDWIVEHGVAEYRGMIIRSRGEGDSCFAVFTLAADAVAAALAIQQTLVAETWETPAPLQVRLALHTGDARRRRGDYYGSSVNRCARLRALAHGGQVLVSEVTAALVRRSLPPEVNLYDLGTHCLRGFDRVERVFQLVHPSLPASFPPLVCPDGHPIHLTTIEVARELRLSPKRVRQLAADGKLPAHRLDGGWLFAREEIDGWFRARRNRYEREQVQPSRGQVSVPANRSSHVELAHAGT
jgi:excisionase family DNA binding protein